jgi:hypothetical protein
MTDLWLTVAPVLLIIAAVALAAAVIAFVVLLISTLIWNRIYGRKRK